MRFPHTFRFTGGGREDQEDIVSSSGAPDTRLVDIDPRRRPARAGPPRTALQKPGGSRAGSPWIRMPTGMPDSTAARVLTGQRSGITSALHLRALANG